MPDIPRPSQPEARRIQNEQEFRDFNVRVRQSVEQSMDEVTKQTLPLGMVCECSNPNCTQRIELTVAQRQHIRRRADYFIIAGGHEDLEIERVVERHEHYSVVEKLNLAP